MLTAGSYSDFNMAGLSFLNARADVVTLQSPAFLQGSGMQLWHGTCLSFVAYCLAVHAKGLQCRVWVHTSHRCG